MSAPMAKTEAPQAVEEAERVARVAAEEAALASVAAQRSKPVVISIVASTEQAKAVKGAMSGAQVLTIVADKDAVQNGQGGAILQAALEAAAAVAAGDGGQLSDALTDRVQQVPGDPLLWEAKPVDLKIGDEMRRFVADYRRFAESP